MMKHQDKQSTSNTYAMVTTSTSSEIARINNDKAKPIPTMGSPKNNPEEMGHVFLGTLFSIIDDITSEDLPEIELDGYLMKIPDHKLIRIKQLLKIELDTHHKCCTSAMFGDLAAVAKNIPSMLFKTAFRRTGKASDEAKIREIIKKFPYDQNLFPSGYSYSYKQKYKSIPYIETLKEQKEKLESYNLEELRNELTEAGCNEYDIFAEVRIRKNGLNILNAYFKIITEHRIKLGIDEETANLFRKGIYQALNKKLEDKEYVMRKEGEQIVLLLAKYPGLEKTMRERLDENINKSGLDIKNIDEDQSTYAGWSPTYNIMQLIDMQKKAIKSDTIQSKNNKALVNSEQVEKIKHEKDFVQRILNIESSVELSKLAEAKFNELYKKVTDEDSGLSVRKKTDKTIDRYLADEEITYNEILGLYYFCQKEHSDDQVNPNLPFGLSPLASKVNILAARPEKQAKLQIKAQLGSLMSKIANTAYDKLEKTYLAAAQDYPRDIREHIQFISNQRKRTIFIEHDTFFSSFDPRFDSLISRLEQMNEDYERQEDIKFARKEAHKAYINKITTIFSFSDGSTRDGIAGAISNTINLLLKDESANYTVILGLYELAAHAQGAWYIPNDLKQRTDISFTMQELGITEKLTAFGNIAINKLNTELSNKLSENPDELEDCLYTIRQARKTRMFTEHEKEFTSFKGKFDRLVEALKRTAAGLNEKQVVKI